METHWVAVQGIEQHSQKESRGGSISTRYERKVRPRGHDGENTSESKQYVCIKWCRVGEINGQLNSKSVGKAKQDAIETIYNMIS